MSPLEEQQLNAYEELGTPEEISEALALATKTHKEDLKAKDCLVLMQSILSHGSFEIETPNEAALVEAMSVAGFPVTIDTDYLNPKKQLAQHKTFMSDLLDQADLAERKLMKCKRLMLLTDPKVSNVQVGETQVTQWGEFCSVFPDEA